jgi:hypothetical protein
MVQFERDPDARYRLLETVRVYAGEKLVAAGELDETSARHADHFERVAAGIEALIAVDVEVGLKLFRLELVNLRAAMTWSYESGRPEQGLSLAVHLRDALWLMQDFREGLTWLRRGLDVVPPSVSPLYIRALYYAMTDAANVEAIDLTDEFRMQAEQLLGVVHDPIMLADLNNAIANTLDGSDPRTGLARYATAIDLYRSAGSDRWVRAQCNRIHPVSLTGDVSDIEIHIQRMYDAERSGLPKMLFSAALLDAWYRLVAGQPDAASQALDKASSSPVLGASVWVGWAKAETLRQQGRSEEAEQEITKLRAVYGDAVDFGDFHLLAVTAAWVALDRGQVALAVERWEFVARLAAPPGQTVWRAATATFHGIVATRRGDWDRGATLLGYAAFESERCGYRPFVFDRHRVDDARVTLREALGHEVFSDAYARGESTPYDDLPLYRAPLTGTR